MVGLSCETASGTASDVFVFSQPFVVKYDTVFGPQTTDLAGLRLDRAGFAPAGRLIHVSGYPLDSTTNEI
jgi:hypothetical protein